MGFNDQEIVALSGAPAIVDAIQACYPVCLPACVRLACLDHLSCAALRVCSMTLPNCNGGHTSHLSTDSRHGVAHSPGAHTLGRAKPTRSGFGKDVTKYTKDGPGTPGGSSWTPEWLKFDNSYFKATPVTWHAVQCINFVPDLLPPAGRCPPILCSLLVCSMGTGQRLLSSGLITATCQHTNLVWATSHVEAALFAWRPMA